MPTRNVDLTPELDEFVAAKIASGRYKDAGEVVREALAGLEREERLAGEDAAKRAALEQAIEEGDASGIYEGDPFEDIRKEFDLPTRVRV